MITLALIHKASIFVDINFQKYNSDLEKKGFVTHKDLFDKRKR